MMDITVGQWLCSNMPVAPDREQRIFLPPTHDKILRRIYSHAELKRIFNNPESGEERIAFNSRIYSHLLPEMGGAFLRVNQFGVNFLDELRLQVRAFSKASRTHRPGPSP